MLASTRSGTIHLRILYLVVSTLGLAILACKMSETNPTTQVLPTSGGNQDGSLKPVGFVNHGSIAATVMAWTYTPLNSESVGIPSIASTVSFPPTAPGLWPNSSRFLLLPLGTYTWCYHWELGDVNNDGMIDYAHAIDNRPVVLDEADSNDLDTAEQVDISAPPGSGELPGRCGQLTDLQGGPLKPVGFVNHGSIATTVSVWTYIPLNSDSLALPSGASTVSFPPTTPGLWPNSSRFLLLPLGTYTWCYSWELGDTNDDGMIDTAHAIDNRPVVLDESDSDDLEFAESVDLGAPADFGVVPGLCGLDISQFIASRNHVDRVIGPYAGLGHDNDSIVLRGPITIALWYIHAAEEIHPGVPTELTTPEIITIPAGETEKFLHVDGRDEHPGDWNMYIWLLSINR